MYLRNILKDTKSIANGDFSLNLQEKGNNELVDLAKSINTIKEAYKKSLEEQLKNERLKTELISNVSHDLKTPLTSMVNYVDLLQRKDISELEGEDYIKILNEKTHKFKILIEDIFERFKRGDASRNSKIEGPGLGLAICKSIVELHGGKMYLEKEGDMFKVFIELISM